ncbi:hypothetical protein J6590_011614 [Homalodisca vitripennis]|nr:hypothetical protein J6590_011614 [Homalodisca vitripennis]
MTGNYVAQKPHRSPGLYRNNLRSEKYRSEKPYRCAFRGHVLRYPVLLAKLSKTEIVPKLKLLSARKG